MSTRGKMNQTGCLTLQPPRMTPEGIEVSLHTCPRAMHRELCHVFPEIDLSSCLAVATSQRAKMDLVGMGDQVEVEKDRLLNSFAVFAFALCNKIREAGFWADFIDPCSGLPMLTGGNKVYSEVEGMQLLLQYQVMNAGSCKVLLHPQWGSSVYPASLFCTAPAEMVLRLLAERLA